MALRSLSSISETELLLCRAQISQHFCICCSFRHWCGRQIPSVDRVGTKKRTRTSQNQNSASRSADLGHAPASPPSRKSSEGSTAQVRKWRHDSCPSLPPRSFAPSTLPPDYGVSEALNSSLPTSPLPFVPILEDHPTHSLSPRGTCWVISRWTLLFRLWEVGLFFYVPTLSRFRIDVR